MIKKKKKFADNYLDRIPVHADIKWSADGDKKITLEIENKGVFNKIAQKFFKKPKISYVHLDDTGSFIWPIIDGEKSIIELGKELEKEFGEKVSPIYERLATYFRILESYGFIIWK